MLITTEKLEVENIPENACRKCDGAGKVCIVPATTNKFFKAEVECLNCRGEKVITQSLLDRKEKAAELKDALHEADLTLREAVKKFGADFTDWNNAVQGKSSLEDIQSKIDLVLSEKEKCEIN